MKKLTSFITLRSIDEKRRRQAIRRLNKQKGPSRYSIFMRTRAKSRSREERQGSAAPTRYIDVMQQGGGGFAAVGGEREAGRETQNEKWALFISNIGDLLGQISFRLKTGQELSNADGFAHWQNMAESVRENRKTLFLIGNGASASMASHFAADLEKNAHLHTQVFSDLSLITAVSNDLGYENVFCEPLRHCASAGDMLLAISSSGCSKNIIKALATARRRGLSLVSLTAMSPGNPIRNLADLNIYVTAETYGLAETCHAAILHYWMDLLDLRRKR